MLLDMRPTCCSKRTRLGASDGQGDRAVTVCEFNAIEERLESAGEADGSVDSIVEAMRPMGALLPQRKSKGIFLLLPFCDRNGGGACEECIASSCARCRSSWSPAERHKLNAAAVRFLQPWDLLETFSCAFYVARSAAASAAAGEAGDERLCGLTIRDGGDDAAPPRTPRMFSAAKAVERAVPILAQEASTAAAAAAAADRPTELLYCVDLACGSGRDVTFLAEELRDSDGRDDRAVWRFIGVDHHARHGRTVATLASNRGVDASVDFVASGDLRKTGVVEELLDRIEGGCCFGGETGRVAAVIVCRFLDRGMMDRVASWLRRRGAGATFIVSTFEGVAACLAHGHPKKPRDILGDGEMASSVLAGWNTGGDDAIRGEACSEHRWDAVVDFLSTVEDGSGRTTREFIARYERPPSMTSSLAAA